ncbi:hypothetical protein LINGRAHAP2_LOCUS12361 [Linum grandiflorum]
MSRALQLVFRIQLFDRLMLRAQLMEPFILVVKDVNLHFYLTCATSFRGSRIIAKMSEASSLVRGSLSHLAPDHLALD